MLALDVPQRDVDRAAAGRVQRAAFLGQTREYEIETLAGQVFVVTPAAAQAFAPGDALVCRLERVIPLRA